jgi:hypothetical protein
MRSNNLRPVDQTPSKNPRNTTLNPEQLQVCLKTSRNRVVGIPVLDGGAEVDLTFIKVLSKWTVALDHSSSLFELAFREIKLMRNVPDIRKRDSVGPGNAVRQIRRGINFPGRGVRWRPKLHVLIVNFQTVLVAIDKFSVVLEV